MAKGKSYYLTETELLAVIDTCTEWCDTMADGEEMTDSVNERLNNGLGSALRKLHVGRIGYKFYEDYKTIR